ncbi:LacI family DNA-binding transcriptional regulator [Neobacillus sp. 179-C4.2 HS]|uniref:LacI family DNA-binding transcriptional regulator n=1 Tax=Neobacillus driksii TaxID=3035913 RepID=A0ABV4YXA3_9BACI|nr:LacI family DNA-binding transcriptional regulator [Neobacillus sp. 179.-C4.2 HS]MDP5192774.1 LacI family DNA-binding transcriptional regulator [Neobacillus sp. 179.-C4.2 HS]
MGVTIKDIATVSGVSFSTVSKALNNSPLVKPATKSKILKIAQEMGYEPNFAARRLVSKETKTIGLVWPSIERAALSTLVTKINAEIEKNHYSMILSINSTKSAVDMFKRFQVDGIIIFKENDDPSSLNPSYLSNIPAISYGHGNQTDIPFIDVNYKKAMYLAVEYLYQLGHRDITYIGDFSIGDSRQTEKYEGFKEAMRHFNLHFKAQNLLNTGGLDWQSGYRATNRLLESSDIPSAIIGGSYDLSGGIIRSIKEQNLIIPKDISVIGYDNIPQMGDLETPLTSIGVPVDVLAKKITDSLFQQIQQPDSIPLIQRLEPELKERMSCAAQVKKD